MKVKAKTIILDLLSAMAGDAVSAQQVIAACALFGLTENNVRVSLARLSAECLIEAAGRGRYQLGPDARRLAGEVATWRNAEQRLRPWGGAWIMVLTAALGRSDRAALRRRQRALGMLGFEEFRRGVYLRPDNIEKDLDAVRLRLTALGLEPAASVFCADGFATAERAEIGRLWDGEALNRRYRALSQQLGEWLARSAELAPEEAAREAFVQGGAAIRQVVFDPWLPAPLIDEVARHDFVQMVERYDAAGREIWQRFFQQCTDGMPAAAGTLRAPALH